MTDIEKTWFVITKEGNENFIPFCRWLNKYNKLNKTNKLKFAENPRQCNFNYNEIEVITTEDTIKLMQEEIKENIETVLTEEEWMEKDEEFRRNNDLDFEVIVVMN